MTDIIRENLKGIMNWAMASFASCVIVFTVNRFQFVQYGKYLTWSEGVMIGLGAYFYFRLSQKLQNIGESETK